MPQVDAAVFKKIRRLEIVSRHLVENILSGNYLSTFRGSGLEFSEVREYEPGDEVRFIDWNVTAKLGKPYIKLFQEERELTVLFAVDVSASQDFGSKGSSKRELAAQACAALGFAAAANGDRVGFLFFSDRVEGVLSPRRGRKHLLRGLRDLLALEPKGTGTAFGPACKALAQLARRSATVFLLSDLQADLNVPELKAAASRYDLIACRLSDQIEEQLPAWMGLLMTRDPETGRLGWVDTDSPWARRRWQRQRSERVEAGVKALRRLRVDSMDLRGDRDLATALVGFFRKREMRGRH